MYDGVASIIYLHKHKQSLNHVKFGEASLQYKTKAFIWKLSLERNVIGKEVIDSTNNKSRFLDYAKPI